METLGFQPGQRWARLAAGTIYAIRHRPTRSAAETPDEGDGSVQLEIVEIDAASA